MELKKETAMKEKTKQKPKYYIVRCQSAGVFCAQVVKRSKDGLQATLKDSRRIWYWAGAASLSQLAVDGTSRPDQCKFPVAMPEQEVTGVLELIPVSEKAKATIDSVRVWQA